MTGNDVIDFLASEEYSPGKPANRHPARTETNSAKFGEIQKAKRSGRDRADDDTMFWYHRMAASIKCIQAPSLCSGSPNYYLYLSRLL